jgi:hypothetical protein
MSPSTLKDRGRVADQDNFLVSKTADGIPNSWVLAEKIEADNQGTLMSKILFKTYA